MKDALGGLDGYVRVAAATPSIRVADCAHNARQVVGLMRRAADEGVRLLCLPELCLTGYTCGDLFLQDTLLRSAMEALSSIVAESAGLPLVTVAGLPVVQEGKLFNAAALICGGELLGLVPKTHIPNYNEFYELRHFSPAPGDIRTVRFGGRDVPMGTRLIFQCLEEPALRLAVEICEDLWIPAPPSSLHAMAGATVIANPSASDEVIGKAAYRRGIAASQSGRLVCAYIYADAGRGESSTDMVFAGHNLICENGELLSESPPFGDGWAATEVDVSALEFDRRRMNTFRRDAGGYQTIRFSLAAAGLQTIHPSSLTRRVDAHPFVPGDEREKSARCEAILDMQAAGLEKRITHIGAKSAVIGISGGLDSCLALLVTARVFAKLGRPVTGIIAVTMPCFGTTARTKSNALRLCEAIGVDCREIDITGSVNANLRDIEQPPESRDVVYENAQARVRTLVLMNLANKSGGIVVGTGDLSELALGWATYNGDHMSMYGVNSGVPKTLVRHIVRHVAEGTPRLFDVLTDILATPVSPELLPPTGGDISQRTESIVGPYELHDFFLYHAVRWGRPPARTFALARTAFRDEYPPDVILSWLRTFYRRFFAQQFKRSCLPDGPKIGSVSLSPRSDWRMPSDASCDTWMRELDGLDS
ncbi:MAG: NAD(+) synthase [Synergistaceae bacterium]|jgi:NAD+ synthase (glutamine-hydrolysing)|nr:NAD(+) synthase [Synergistaceae bacterium]